MKISAQFPIIEYNKIVKMSILIGCFISFFTFHSFAQTITFDNQAWANSQDVTSLMKSVDGFAFRFFVSGVEQSAGGSTVTFDEDNGSGGSGALFPGFFSSSGISMSKIDNSAFELQSFYLEGGFSSNTGLIITAYLNGNPVGVPQSVPAIAGGASTTVILSGDFDNVDSLYISDNGALFGFDALFDHFVYGPILPVELTSFEGEVLEEAVLLQWETASEINNRKFIIEESYDGKEFKIIGDVQGNGTTLEQQNYSFIIENPERGNNYFRLKQIDFDGQINYSKIINVHFETEIKKAVNFYPNPSKSGLVNVDFKAEKEEKITVLVFDMAGKLLIKQEHFISSGSNNLSFDFSELEIGIYMVKLGNETIRTEGKLIIGR